MPVFTMTYELEALTNWAFTHLEVQGTTDAQLSKVPLPDNIGYPCMNDK
jgi:hypothetical protein